MFPVDIYWLSENEKCYVLGRVPQGNRINKEIYYEELPHTMREAKESHGLLGAS